jgi:fibronectin-binding autotransporter adhesin
MKSYTRHYSLFLSAVIAVLPLAAKSTVFFHDTFGSGSTLTNTTPAAPTPASTAYQISSSKGERSSTGLTANDLNFGINTSSSGGAELEALFTTTPVALGTVGDYIRLTVTFTNNGLLDTNCLLGFGLYNGSQVQPIAGGLNGTAVNSFTDHATGGVQNWQGYWGQTSFTNGNSSIVLRLPQTAGTDNRDQNLTSTGSGSQSYGTPKATTIGTAVNAGASVVLTDGQVYTAVLIIQLTDVSTLAITNIFYQGADTNGTVISQYGASASGSSYTGDVFDGLAIGWRSLANNTIGTAMDISSILVDGSVTAITAPPTITLEPQDTTVALGGTSPFTIAAQGVNVSYQWKLNGTNLVNSAKYSGATSSQLVINNASAADAATELNGYYCVVSGAGNFSTNSVTNSLDVVAVTNLVWNGQGNVWDVTNSPNWTDGTNPSLVFTYGDPVTFDDTGAGNIIVTLTGNFLSAPTWKIAGSTSYAFNGSGSFAGPGQLIFNSGASGSIQMNVANTHTGGTIISNSNPSLDVDMMQYQVLGNGPLTLATPGLLEVAPVGSASLGFPGNVAVNDDFTMQFDGNGTFAGVFLGTLSGNAGKTLTLNPRIEGTTNRVRVYGANLTMDANIAIDPNGSPVTMAQYNGMTLASYQSSPDSQTYNGTISGTGGLIQRASGNTILNAANTYSGGTTVTTGAIGIGNNQALGSGAIILAPELGSSTGSGAYFASGGARTVANTILYPDSTTNQTFTIGGTNNLTFTGPYSLAGADGSVTPTNRIIQVTNQAATILAMAISDSGAGDAITKTGVGVLYLNGANTFTGTNIVSAGRLAGSGSVAGPVIVQTNGAIGGGATSIGTFTVGGDLTLNSGGNVFIRVNKQLAPSNDVISVTGALSHTALGTNGGTVTVTNLSPAVAIAAGDTFKIFNKAVTSGNTMTITGAGLTWTNNLAVDGSITAGPAVSTVATNPTNMTFSVSGTNLTISWPADHQGWYLQMNTNSLSSNTWTDVANSNTGTNSVIPIDPTRRNAFFRMSLNP